MDKVKLFDGDNIEDNIKEPCDKIAKDPAKKFNEKDMLGQNFAASKLCAWVVNILDYNRIFKIINNCVHVVGCVDILTFNVHLQHLMLMAHGARESQICFGLVYNRKNTVL